MQITKIHFKEDRVRIEYQTSFTKGDEVKVNKFVVDCAESPRQEFHTTLGSLRDDVIEICELEEEFAASMRIIGVTFAHDDDIWGATISAAKTLKKSRSPFIIHTPYKPAVPDTGDNNRISCLSVASVSKLEKLMECAKGYVKGDRLQPSLFQDAEKKAKPEKKAAGEKFSEN